MEVNNRNDIKNFINKLESEFPVNSWKFNTIHLWPIIRLNLYFQLIYKTEIEPNTVQDSSKPNSNTPLKQRSKLSILKNALQYKVWLTNLKRKKFLFVGSDAHRTYYQGLFQNKFFDPLIQHFKIEKESAVLEYQENKSRKINYSNLSIDYLDYAGKAEDYYKLKQIFGGRKTTIELEGYDRFIDYLAIHEITKSFAAYNSQKNFQKRIEAYAFHFENFCAILKKIKPKKLFMLCYYFDLGMLLMAAANKLGIETIEMQHGPQTEEHLAYSGWSVLPQNGYDMLPRNYWCWDSVSKNVINENFAHHSLYSAFIGGNPWIEYTDFSNDLNYMEPFVLYTLQPSPVDLKDTFSENIISAIQNSSYKWLIKLHPRQMTDLQKVKNILAENLLLEKTDVEIANELPLPALLSGCVFNVTHFSGTALEATIMGKKTVVLNEIGQKAFAELINSKKAEFINFKSNKFTEDFKHFEKKTVSDRNIKNAGEIHREYIERIFS